MDYRYLGRSGLRVSTLTMGTMTFGGGGNFAKVGASDLDEARRLIDLCLDAGVNLLDTANVYSTGVSEEIIGEAVAGKRHDVLIASKVRFRMGEGQNDEGLSRWHILRQVEASLKRLRTDVIDILYLHEWDGMTPLDETLGALDTLVAQGKIRYAGASNYSGWHLMKALGLAERHGSLASSPSRSTTASRPARPSTNSPRSRSPRASASWSGARSPAGCSRASTAPTRPRPASSPAGASRRSATSTGSGESSPPSRRSAPRAASRPRRSRSPGCSAAPASSRW